MSSPRSPIRETRLEFADLAALVYPASIPDGLADDLERLYGSLFSTIDWFVTHDDAQPDGVCVLERPSHVLMFRVAGDTVDVLNKTFEIAPRDVRRACAALFRAFPDARRIHIEVMCPPEDLHIPTRILYSTDHMIIDLPDSADDYYRSLGRSTRRNLRSATNRLRREHPEAETSVFEPKEEAAALLDEFLQWKRARFRDRGRTTYWDDDPGLEKRFLELLQRRGEAHVLEIAGHPAAINFVFPVGDTICAQESSFDLRYTRYDLGLLNQYQTVVDAIERGSHRMNLLWGSEAHKKHFGAVAHRATALSVFRSRTGRLWSLDEATEVGRRRLRKASEAYYWKSRHAARDRVAGLRRRIARSPIADD